MRRKEVERRSKRYAAVQNVSVVGWYMDAEDFHHVVEFRTTKGETLAISVPSGETRVLKHFQQRMPYGLFVPDVL